MENADFHTYFVGCDEWGFSVWAHNAECTVSEARAAAEALGEGTLSHKSASRLAYALRSEDPILIQRAVSEARLKSSLADIQNAVRAIQELGIPGKDLSASLRVVGNDLQLLQWLRETGMSGPEIAQYLRTLGDVPVFRGTTSGFSGNPGSIAHARTPVSIEPARATAFAVEVNTRYGYGEVQIGSRTSLGGRLSHGNRSTPELIVVERELNALMTPVEFAGVATTRVPVHAARDILAGMGIDVPPMIRGLGGLRTELGNLPIMTPEQIQMFLRQAGSI